MQPGPEADRRVRVLIVEDEPTNRAKTARILESAGFEVEEAGSARECLRAAREKRHDLIMLDETLPDGNGYELSRQIKMNPALGRNCSILMSTVKPLTGERRVGYETGVDEWITRPVPDDELLTKVRSLTLRRNVEIRFQESESEFRGIFDELPMGAAVLALDGRFLRVNKALCRLTGYSPDEMTAMKCEDIIHSDDASPFAAGLNRLISGEVDEQKSESRCKDRDGATVSTRVSVKIVRDRTDDPPFFLVLLEDATETVGAEEALKESESKYRHLVENLHEGLWCIDEDANTTFVNERMADILGYTAEEMLGRHLFSFMDCRGVEMSKRNLERRKQGIKEDHEFELLRKDGTRIYTIMQTSPITDADGNYRGALAGVLDITERKSAEDSLHEAHGELERRVTDRTTDLETAISELKEEVVERRRVEGLFRQLLESAPDAMVVANQRGKITLVSALTEKLFGYTKDELIGQSIEILVPEQYRGTHQKHRKEYNENPHVRPMGVGIELAAVRKDGSEFPAEISLGPLKTDEGIMVFTAIRDITERKRAETELRESRERFDLAVRGTDAGIWDWDLRSNEVYFSARWKSMLGHGDDEINNEYAEWEKRLHPDDRDRALTTIQEYLDGKSQEYELEHRLRHSDGSYRWILARGALVRDSDGKPYRMVGSHIDITRRKKAEESLREKETQLRAAQRIQEHLLPETSPHFPGFDIAGTSFPADFAAGDYFDYFEMPDGTWSIAIGDVSGHGFSSALLMASTHAHLRSLAETGIGVDEILARANASLFKTTDVGNFVTVMLASLDPRSRKLIYSSAGHPAGFLLDQAGHVKTELTSTALPLAVLSDADYVASDAITLEPGDIVLLLTDGVLEAASDDDEDFGVERTLLFVRDNCHKPAVEIAEGLCRAARDFCEHDKHQDDVTAVVIKVKSDS